MKKKNRSFGAKSAKSSLKFLLGESTKQQTSQNHPTAIIAGCTTRHHYTNICAQTALKKLIIAHRARLPICRHRLSRRRVAMMVRGPSSRLCLSYIMSYLKKKNFNSGTVSIHTAILKTQKKPNQTYTNAAFSVQVMLQKWSAVKLFSQTTVAIEFCLIRTATLNRNLGRKRKFELERKSCLFFSFAFFRIKTNTAWLPCSPLLVIIICLFLNLQGHRKKTREAWMHRMHGFAFRFMLLHM